ncbi:MAG: HEAT repeat domain-containing protein [Myxococcota bacterium]|jgi:hypothetical protein|nr:HEAT repeat domain-containing protein [Myxococcota bacterium]
MRLGLVLVLLFGSLASAQSSPTSVPPSTSPARALSLALGGPALPVRFEARAVDAGSGAASGTLIVGRGRAEARIELPLRTPTIDVRVVRIAGRSVGIVELREAPRHFAVVIDAPGGRPVARWTGRLELHGDPGERRRDVLQVADRTGDGVDDVVVASIEEARGICGVETWLDPHAIDPRSGELRPVALRSLPEVPNEPELAARSERPTELAGDLPLVRALVPRATTSTAGIASAVAPPPTALTDGDTSTAWIEGHPSNGRWEAATFGWIATGLHARHLALVPPPEPTRVPSAVWLVHDGGRVRVRAPDAPGTWWITLPDAIETRCLSVVLDAPSGEPATAHTGLAEVRAFTEVESGGGLDTLFTKLAGGGSEGDEAARVLTLVGEAAMPEVARRWPDMPSAERRALVPLLARSVSRDDAKALLRAAARAEEELLRDAALDACERVGPPGHELLGELVIDPAVGDDAAVRVARVAPSVALRPLLAAFAIDGGASRPALRDALRVAAARAPRSADAIDAWVLGSPAAGARAAVTLALAPADETRALAVRVLTGFDGSDAFEDRWRVVSAARFLPRESTNGWVTNLTHAEEWMLRREAVRAIATWPHDDESRALARPLLDDPYPRVRAAAATALAALEPTERDVEAIAVLARRDKWPLVRAAGIEALTGFERALPILRVGVDDPSRRVRAAAIDGLRVRADDGSWARIEARMNDDGEWPEVISAGIRFARERCLEAGVPTLTAVIERGRRPDAWAPDVDLAMAAIDALVAIGGAEAEATLTRAASESSPPPLRAAANSRERVTQRCTR